MIIQGLSDFLDSTNEVVRKLTYKESVRRMWGQNA